MYIPPCHQIEISISNFVNANFVLEIENDNVPLVMFQGISLRARRNTFILYAFVLQCGDTQFSIFPM